MQIVEEGVFRAVQLRAGKNNVRPSHWGSDDAGAEGTLQLHPTLLFSTVTD